MGSFDALSEIAPTVVFTIPGMAGTGFEERLVSNINDVAFLLGDEASAQAHLEKLEADMNTVQTLVGSLEPKNALFLTAIGKTVNLFTDNPESRFGFVYNELGFDAASAVEEIQEEDKKVNNGESSRHGNSVSFEFISAKNPSHILVLDLGIATGRF